MTINNREWARNFRGTINEFIEQAKLKGLSNKSTQYWVKYNWNFKVKEFYIEHREVK